MKIDKELLEKASHLSDKRFIELSEEDARQHIKTLDESQAVKDTVLLGLLEKLKGTSASAILQTVYGMGFTTGYAYRELETASATDAVQPEVKGATAG